MEKIRELHDAIKYHKRKWVGSYYYDYPDGEDLIGKLNYTVKIALTASAVTGLAYAYTVPLTDTAGKLVRLGKCVVPGVGMAFAFTCVTYYATKFRGKDDEWNYILGGMAAGSLLGPATGRVGFGILSMIVCSTIGGAKKSVQLQGKTIIPNYTPQKRFGTYYLRKLDTTVAPELPGNWTKHAPQK